MWPTLVQLHLFQLTSRNENVKPELSTGRMDPRGGSGSGRVGSVGVDDFAGFWRVGSGRVSTSDFLNFLLIISQCLNRSESSNTTFGLIDFRRYSIYNN